MQTATSRKSTHMHYRVIPFFLLLLISCKEESPLESDEENVSAIELTSLSSDSTSIRALQRGDNEFWFAGSSGSYGKVIDSLGTVAFGKVIYNGMENLEFRSIAVTTDYTYILTAGNPALIYQISHENDSLALVYEESGEKVFYDSLQFWDDMNGIAMGDPQQDCFTLLITRNGGENWDKIPCSSLPALIEGEAAYAASNSNIALQGDHIWLATGGQAARLLHSPDRGKSWEALETPITSGGEMTGIYAVDFFDDQLGIIIGGDWNDQKNKSANKALTTDGGKTWKLIADGEGPGYSSDISFIPGTEGKELLAVGMPGIWWSGDQGASWKQLSTEGFYTIAFTNKSKGLLAGKYKMNSFELKRTED